ncbi:MAG: glycerophosphodiester phosphodiesterase [Elusimicrobiota bacterium]
MVLKIGHRGAAGYEPENTIISVEKAIELKVDMIEIDAQLCKSGEVIVFHNNRIAGSGYIADKTLLELKKYDLIKGQKIPTLEEVLDCINRRTKVNIEIKCEGAAKKIYSVLEHYVKEKGWKWDDFLVSFFNHYELLEFQKYSNKINLGALIAGIPLGYAECAAKLNAYSLNVSIKFINQNLVDDAHKRGLKLLVYTANEKEEIENLKSMGVDGIFSDFPDRI